MIGQFATQEERASLSSFMAEHAITCRVTPTTNRATDEWKADADAWLVTFRRQGKRFGVRFYMGRGHNGAPPTPESALSCLADDCAGLENAGASFDAWAREYGYDEDSRKYHAAWRQVGKQRDRLLAFLGTDAYDTLLWETERD